MFFLFSAYSRLQIRNWPRHWCLQPKTRAAAPCLIWPTSSSPLRCPPPWTLRTLPSAPTIARETWPPATHTASAPPAKVTSQSSTFQNHRCTEFGNTVRNSEFSCWHQKLGDDDTTWCQHVRQFAEMYLIYVSLSLAFYDSWDSERYVCCFVSQQDRPPPSRADRTTTWSTRTPTSTSPYSSPPPCRHPSPSPR